MNTDTKHARILPRARLAAHLAGYAMGVPSDEIWSSARGRRDAAAARQLAMYLTHTVFSASLHTTAIAFDRDRSTVAHACRQIEDLRDDALFDSWLERVEDALRELPPPPDDWVRTWTGPYPTPRQAWAAFANARMRSTIEAKPLER